MLRRILLLCTGNICRSPMAEYLLAPALAERLDDAVVASAGLAAPEGRPADPLAVELLQERGIDLGEHRSRQASAAMCCDFDLILVMERSQRRVVERQWPLLTGRVHTLGHWGGFDIDDPYRRPRAAFEDALRGIDQGLAQWLPRLTGEAPP